MTKDNRRDFLKKIKVVDAICGAGKSTAAINMINKSDDSKRYLYITPYLDEVERIKQSCPEKKFYDPKEFGSKLTHIKKLISEGRNIVSTHSLFAKFDADTMELAYLNNYTLIMDEVADVVYPCDITMSDTKVLLENYVERNEDGSLTWTDPNYTGRFDDYKRLCDLGCVYLYSNVNAEQSLFIWVFPIRVFEAFREVYLLTYLFGAQVQKYYYDFYQVEYEFLYVKDFEFTEVPQSYDVSKYKSLITVVENDKLNMLGELDYSFSKSWFTKHKDNAIISQVKKNTQNFFRNVANSPADKNMWTTFKSLSPSIQGKGYSKGFVSLNMRATNQYRGKDTIAYLANRYLNPLIKNFFLTNGVKVDEDAFALSELIQFIFRSQIRDEKPITIYLPSKRMRTILLNWE